MHVQPVLPLPRRRGRRDDVPAPSIAAALDRWGPAAEMLRWWFETSSDESVEPGVALVDSSDAVRALAGRARREVPLIVAADHAEAARALGNAWPKGGFDAQRDASTTEADESAAFIGAVGPDDLAWSFAAARLRASARRVRLRVGRLYRLHAAPAVPVASAVAAGRSADPADGQVRTAGEADHDLVQAWADAFCRELAFPLTPRSADGRVAAITDGDVRLLDVGGEPVAVAKCTRPTSRSCSIGFVYVPPARRREGRARQLMKAVTEEIRRSHRQPLLFTDRDAEGPERLYASLGYVPVTDWIDLRQEPTESAR